MKRLLVIANLHHASPRIPALLSYLSECGWTAKIVTPNPGDDFQSTVGIPEGFLEKVDLAVAPFRGDIFWPIRRGLDLFGFSIESSYSEQLKRKDAGGHIWVDRTIRIFQAFVAIPDTEWTWHRSALKVARKAIEKDGYDVILSSSPHPTVHRVASMLKKRYRIPWVADFRDPWSQNHNYDLPRFRQRFDRWMEIRTLRNVDQITTVSTGFAEKLSGLHGDRVSVVRNGFQPISDRSEAPSPDVFRISYTGTIYAGKQDPTKILRALKKMLEKEEIDPSRFALEFFGHYDSGLQKSIEEYELTDLVEQKGTLPRAEIRKLQMSSHLLLLLQWEDPEEKGIFPLKFYEYMDSRRPILATGGDASSEIAGILEETGTGSVAIDVDEIVNVLKRSINSFVSDGALEFNGDICRIEKYSYLGAAKKLREILDRVASFNTSGE